MSFERLQDLFHRAAELEPTARRAFLEEACEGDDALLASVVGLLDAEDEVGDSFLSLRPSTLEAVVPRPPEQIGRYRVIRELGRGGMGIVFEAEQEEPKRRVAVKVVRQAFATPELVARFEREADVLGRLHHAGIAHIYEAGTAEVDGERWPFFAMELIDGRPLDLHVEAHGVSERERLAIFAQVCDAVEHAHQNGVIHRDLKPSNILVDAQGQPKILDFGVARATDPERNGASIHTATGQVVGTVGYMSPEQLSGDVGAVGVRSDVYALGVVLFRLLSGSLPYEVRGKTLPELVRIIHDEEPSRIGSLNPRWQGDIETIIGKALERDPERRYASAAELASDVRHYLSNEPIRARRPSTSYRIRKFARRNPAVVLGTLGTVAALAIGLVAATFALVEARQERDAKNEALEVSRAVTQFLTATLSEADPRKGSRDRTVRESLEAASERVARDFAEQPRIRAELRSTIGETLFELGDYEKAESEQRTAVELWTALEGADALRTNQARIQLGRTRIFLGRLDEARRDAESAHEHLVNAHPDALPMQLFALKIAGGAALYQGRVDEARRIFERGLPLLAAVRARDPKQALSFEVNRIGVLTRTGQLATAIPQLDALVDDFREVYGPEHPETLSVLGIRALAERDVDPERAARHFSEAIDLQKKVVGEAHEERLIVINQYARLLSKMGRHDEAQRRLDEAISIATQSRDGDVPSFLLYALGRVHADAGRLEQAEGAFADTLASSLRESGAQSDSTLRTLDALVSVRLDLHRWAEAEAAARRRVAGLVATRDPGSEDWVSAELQLVRALDGQAKLEEAGSILEALHDATPATKQAEVRDAAVAFYARRKRPDDVARWRAWPASDAER